MGFVLFDNPLARIELLPFTFTRPVCEIRTGILTIREKWELVLDAPAGYLTQDYLSKKFPLKIKGPSLFINGKICPDPHLVKTVQQLEQGQALYKHSEVIAFYGQASDFQDLSAFQKIEFTGDLISIDRVVDIFGKNGKALQMDFELLTRNKTSQPLSNSVTVIGDKNLVFLAEGAKAEACILNVTAGPVYLGKDAEIMEGSIVRGPLALCEHSTLKLGTKIYGPTTIGPHSKVGGEMSNSVIFGYSNKGHDGFLGSSVIGEWCNLGADTNNSNLKNNYSTVKLFHYGQDQAVDTGLQFCGLIMGDHSKSGINTMFNTGTVVGVGANIYGSGFPPTHIPSFSWGGSTGFVPYQLDKLIETAERMFERRGLTLDEIEKELLKQVFDQTAKAR